jgi:GT2 family glycosyltransferase
MKYKITCSIVTYHNDRETLKNTIKSFLGNNYSAKLYIIDNSNNDSLRDICNDARCEYIFNNANLGFGRAHNIALKKSINESTYHLVLNPDVSFPQETLPLLIDYMDANTDVALVLPKVLDFEHQVQYACKRLPSPIDLIIRRLKLNFLTRLFEQRLYFYEMRDMDYNKPFEAPSLSGCFMLFKVNALNKVGLFDERYFMYMEDIDITRRVNEYFKTQYYPKAQIFHGHARESYRLNKLLLIHIISAIKYFNKWGWIFDSKRKKINQINTLD